jgi:hypothetical protein
MGRSVQDFNASDIPIHIIVKDEPIFDLVAFVMFPLPKLDVERISFFIISDSHRFPSKYLSSFEIQ